MLVTALLCAGALPAHAAWDPASLLPAGDVCEQLIDITHGAPGTTTCTQVSTRKAPDGSTLVVYALLEPDSDASTTYFMVTQDKQGHRWVLMRTEHQIQEMCEMSTCRAGSLKLAWKALRVAKQPAVALVMTYTYVGWEHFGERADGSESTRRPSWCA